MTDFDKWELVIGLEIHVQLSTRTKIFSPTPNTFGAEPNENIGIVDTGQPGALPVLNKEAVRKAVMFGLAIDAEIPLLSRFDRKSYFYPDSPRNFQITQFNHPIIRGGAVVTQKKSYAIHEAHLEDDAGMLKHFSDFAGVDYNRAGAPLLEIVSEPCISSPVEATDYATNVRAIMQYLGAANCNMEEGGMRFDVNISVRPKGSDELRPKCEIKNLNSFTNMEGAIESEFRRQVKAYENGETIQSATYRFDVATQQTILMRTKEDAKDYRYFPEPDLPPLILTREYLGEVKSNLPELPHARYERYLSEYTLGEYFADLLVSDKPLSDHFEEGLKTTKNHKSLCNWIAVEFVGRTKETGKTLPPSRDIAQLVNLIDAGTITGKIAKKVADEMMMHPGKTPEAIIEENPDFKPLDDTSTIEPIIDQILKDNPQSIADYHAGKDRAYNFLVGQVMKQTRGKASPQVVQSLLKSKLT